MKLTLANQITILRILLIIPFVIFMLEVDDPSEGGVMRYLALAVFVAMALSDALDGYLARSRGQQTDLGRVLDPLADKLLITTALVLLAHPATAVPGFKLPIPVVILILSKDVALVLGVVLVYMMTGKSRIRPIWAGKVSTFLQLTMAAAVLIGPEMAAWIGFWEPLTRVLWWSAAGMAVTAMLVYIRDGIEYIEEFGNGQRTNHSE